MLFSYHFATVAWCTLLSLLFLLNPAFGELVEQQQQPLILKYHNGELLKGRITVNLLWYGTFTPIQRSIIIDYINSLSYSSSSSSPSQSTVLLPSVASWWKTTENYKGIIGRQSSTTLVVGKQILHQSYPLGKYLKENHLLSLSSTFNNKLSLSLSLSQINVILTAKDVVVDGFCRSRCGTHGSTRPVGKNKTRTAYVWVGNSELQCPGQCAWPFHQPIYGPQTPPLVAPNGDVGVDGMIINLATLLAGAVTNPFNNGYFQGPVTAPLEAVSACTGVFGSGAYPGYPGEVLVEKGTGASYNAHGSNGRKYLLPAMWDPQTSACKTLV